jgi:hypothetical protein
MMSLKKHELSFCLGSLTSLDKHKLLLEFTGKYHSSSHVLRYMHAGFCMPGVALLKSYLSSNSARSKSGGVESGWLCSKLLHLNLCSS